MILSVCDIYLLILLLNYAGRPALSAGKEYLTATQVNGQWKEGHMVHFSKVQYGMHRSTGGFVFFCFGGVLRREIGWQALICSTSAIDIGRN